MAYEYLGKFNTALADFQKVRELEPGTKMASEGIVRVTKAIKMEEKLAANGA